MEVCFACFGALVALGIVLLVKWIWVKPKMLERYLRRQGLPGTPYTPLVGDLRTFRRFMQARSKPIHLTDDIVPRVLPFTILESHGKNFFTWMGPVPVIMIMNPEQIKEVFNKVYELQKQPPIPMVRLINNGVLSYNGDKWAKHRRIVNPAFHQEKLKNMVPAFYESCSEFAGEWDRLVTEKGSSCEIDVWPWIVNLTGDVISRAGFSHSYKEGHKILQLIAKISQLLVQAFWKSHIPGMRFYPNGSNRRMKEMEKEIRVILREMIRKREKAREDGEPPNEDLLGTLLESNSRQPQGNGMAVEEVIAECKAFYVAGKETTSVLLVWTMVLLSQHQDWQARAREEVMQVLGEKKPDWNSLNSLKVVTMILYEVMRLYPPSPSINRVVTKEVKLVGDVTLPRGVQVTIPTLLVHRDTELWGKDATEFNPEKFKEGIVRATKNKLSYFPFGGGARLCMGQNFALLEAKMALALILQRFSFELSPSYVHAPYWVGTIQPQFGAHLILHKL